jgi:hypothetical protein
MKTTILAVLGALASMASAQDEPYYNVTSKPFHLVVKSATNKTLNDRTLSPCHEGAAIEALCLGGKKLSTASVYNFNTSSYTTPTNSAIGDTGILTWLLPTADNVSYSSALTLTANPTSNVAVPLLMPGDDEAQQVAFDKKGLLNIQGYLDDSVFPFNATETKAYYRWYICVTQVGYQYTTLAWVCTSLTFPSFQHVRKLIMDYRHMARPSRRTRLARRSMSSVSGRTPRDPSRWSRSTDRCIGGNC